MSQSDMAVSVVVPTLNRPEPLRRALRSLKSQALDHDLGVEIVVVDNSPGGDAWPVVEPFLAGSGPLVRYVSEPAPGVAKARNRGVAEARGALIAFLDDDEEAGPDWIRRHVATLRATGADASFGPVVVRGDQGGEVGPFARYFERRFRRPPNADITHLAAYMGTNNSMFVAARCLAAPEPFNRTLDSVGGEDSLLLQQLVRSGRRLAWSAEAEVTEWTPPRRLTWAYVRRRRFLSGQTRCFVLVMLKPRPVHEIVTWMAVGAGQAVAYGGLSMLARFFAQRQAHYFEVKAVGGLGKIFWMKRFRPQLYGLGLVS